MTTIRCVAFDLGTANLGIGVVDKAIDGSFRAIAAKYATTSRREDGNRTTEDDLRRMLLLHSAICNVLDKSKPTCVAFESYAIYPDKTGPKFKASCRQMLDLFSWAPAGARPEGIGASELITRAAGRSGFVYTLAELLDEIHQIFEEASDTRGRGDASKVLMVAGLVVAAAAARKLPVYSFLPSDLKTRFHKRDADGKFAKSSSSRDHKQKTERGLRAEVLELDLVFRQSGIHGYQIEHCVDALGHAVLGAERHARG